MLGARRGAHPDHSKWVRPGPIGLCAPLCGLTRAVPDLEAVLLADALQGGDLIDRVRLSSWLVTLRPVQRDRIRLLSQSVCNRLTVELRRRA